MTYPNPLMEHKIITKSGQLLDLKEPNPNDIRIDDIAHGLSRQYRYGGALGDYTVAQHCVLVAKCVYDNWPGESHQGLEDAMRLALMHDAAEAYIRDMPTPAKRLLPDYINLETDLLGVILSKFEVLSQWTDMVREADSSACGAESRQFVLHLQIADMDDLFPPEILPIDRDMLKTPWDPDRAKAMFLLLWESLLPSNRHKPITWGQHANV